LLWPPGVRVPALVGVFHQPRRNGGHRHVLLLCGTLMTQMAANFNIVPAALPGLPDKNAVIRTRWPGALAVLAFNIVFMHSLIRP